MLYFAYGSNMDVATLQDRCPSAQALLNARLLNHELASTRTSIKRRCGVADVLPKADEFVWGVVYHIEEKERTKLDEAEGVHVQAYEGKSVDVLAAHDKRPVKLWTYTVCKKETPRPLPSGDYLNLLLLGARHHKLPKDYIVALANIPTS